MGCLGGCGVSVMDRDVEIIKLFSWGGRNKRREKCQTYAKQTKLASFKVPT